MKRLWIALIALGVFSYGAVANDYHAGSEFASGLKNTGTDTLKNTDPVNIIPHYTANPSESEYYSGVTGGAATGLENAGMNAMTDSEAGKTTSEVVKNRPPDKLNLDAPFLKPGIDMRDEATVTAGQVTVPCQDVTLDKTEITAHQCERTPAATLACTRTAKITWEEVDGWETRTVTILPHQFMFRKVGGGRSSGFIFEFRAPVSGVVQTGVLNVWVQDGTLYNRTGMFMNTSIKLWKSETNTLNAHGIALQENALISSGAFSGSGAWADKITNSILDRFRGKSATLTLTLTVLVKTKVPSPKIEWVEHCPFDKSEEVNIESQCTEAGGTKTVTVGGRQYDIYSDCWQYTDYYVQQDADNGTCSEYMNNTACSIAKTVCLESVGSTCLREQALFSCQNAVSGSGKMCGVELICASGECEQIKNNKTDSFQKAVSALAAVAAAGQDVAAINDVNVRAFTGQRQTCRKAAAGFNNCCKNSGWGNDIGLAHCDSEEKALGKAKDRKLTVYVGSYCSNKVLGICLQKKEAYCVFDSKLAKIVQEQGRYWQLGINFGSAKNTDCRGISVDELQAIQFDRLNFADFYADLESGTDIPADQALIDRVKDQIANGLQGVGGAQ
ncbi:TPA: conjugal transfer protein TraN [Providencia alcalifaciens]|uniref:conjugal transfer protein TraN n=1 Tax=Providencia alcalifaciens TaxID=126385 RepID=UPI00044BAF75|nr:conjugal transfer protein TraN [Providencia alcalifaciens]ECH8679206.1 conjugal transfer protein TraN [Salmonella enterica subsp. enterica serovar Agona]ETT06357.1 putative type-F conjugative transfer system mating-pair stabilization protein TraN [Providencia alcalifaciens F90-2004]